MACVSYHLNSFKSSSSIQAEAELTGDLCDGALTLQLTGGLDSLVWPQASSSPTRRDGLWTSTCLELFLYSAKEPSYLELNMSPCGDWQIYRFQGYRDGQEAPEVSSPPLQVFSPYKGRLVVTWKDNLWLSLLPSLGADCQAAVTAVVEYYGDLAYLAQEHPDDKPDFHRMLGSKSFGAHQPA